MLLVFQRVKKNNHAWIYIFTRVMLLVIQRVEKNNHAWIYIFTRVMLLVIQRVEKNNHALIYIFTRVMLLVIQRVEKNNQAWIYIFIHSIVSRVCAWQRKYPRVKISCENKYRPVMPSRALTDDHFYTTYISVILALWALSCNSH